MAGRPVDVKRAWADVRKVISTDDPAEFGKYLGRSHRRGYKSTSSLPLGLIDNFNKNGSDTVESLASKAEKLLTKETLSATKSNDEALPSVEYEMSGYLEQRVELYLELADCEEHSLRFAPTPSLDDNALQDEDLKVAGKLGSHAAKILMKILYAARMCRYDLLSTVCSLARNITKWSRVRDWKMHRIIAYRHHRKDFALTSIVGDSTEKCKLLLFADADFAGDKSTSKSTSGGVLVLVGPRAWAPLGAIRKAQGAVSHSTAEAEVISFEVGLRIEGLPTLIFWDFVHPYLCSSGGPGPKTKTPAFTARGDGSHEPGGTRARHQEPRGTRAKNENSVAVHA